MELRHPGLYIQQELTKRGRTQKDFANILGKKVSEVNELIKGKRNITIQRDILLATIFDTAPKKWIGLQVEYDYETESQSVDMQKITDIKTRKQNLDVERLKDKPVEDCEVVISEDIRNQTSEVRHQVEKKEMPSNTVAIPEESSTIQDTETSKQVTSGDKKDRKKGHEIFRNF